MAERFAPVCPLGCGWRGTALYAGSIPPTVRYADNEISEAFAHLLDKHYDPSANGHHQPWAGMNVSYERAP